MPLSQSFIKSSCVKWNRLFSVLLISGLQLSDGAFAQTGSSQDAPLTNRATARYESFGTFINQVSNPVQIQSGQALIDPLGRLLGCSGQPLANYDGFSMAVYEPGSNGLDIDNLVALTPTEGEDSIPPNIDNINPYPLSDGQGQYNFLLDANAPLSSSINAGLNQTSVGAQYILAINPPEDSVYSERRVRIEILETTNQANNTGSLSYRAVSLDGQPIGIDGQTELVRTATIRDAASQGLLFFELGLDTVLCESSQIRITKSADRSAAQPGDTVAYRLLVQNLVAPELGSVVVDDTLPVGFELLPGSVFATVEGRPVEVSVRQSGSTISFVVGGTIAANQALEIVYATRITPDAIRGSGVSTAFVTAERSDNRFQIQDGPSTHRLVLDPGIFSDCGTLIGRVFEDKNFDGEQQSGEAGIPNAVIFLDDGNRVVTDADGLFSVQKMLPGQRTGTLDISSLPGYTLAPNLYFNERNSPSRLVNLSPGGLVKMNFGVTPTFQEEG